MAGQGGVRATCSQIEQARYLIERKRQLAHHDDKRNREEVEAVIHRRVTQKCEEGLRGSKNLLPTTMIRQHDSALNRRQSDSFISSFG